MENKSHFEDGLELRGDFNNRIISWIQIGAWTALLLGAEPLLYVFAWRLIPGDWVALFPQEFWLVVVLVGLSILLACGIILLMLLLIATRMSVAEIPGHFRIYLVVVLAGTSIGCALGWLVYMLSWKS